jgi:ADP-heptose:LPS heptosyltransferase
LTFKIRKENYDIVIDFEQFISLSSILTFFSKSKSTIGFNNPFSRRAVLYSEGVNYVEDRHMEDIFKTLLMPFLGDANKNTEVNFNFTRQESKVKEVLGKNNLRYGYDFIIVIHPGTSSNFEKRRWPTEKFEYLSNLLLENFDVKLVFTGKGIGESALIEGIINNLGSPSRAINSCNLFNLEEFIALIKLSNLVITNDTAPVQIAPALHIPCLALFGPNTPFLYGPRHERSKFIYKYLACSPCITNLNNKQSSCINAGCMNRISVEEVFKSVEPYCQEYRIIYGETQDKNFSKPKQVTV